MRVVCDVEANGIDNPTKIWVIVCKDIDTNEIYIFRNLTENESDRSRFKELAGRVSLWIGHNFLGYDILVLRDLIGCDIPWDNVCDTLIVSKLHDYSRDGHSLEDYGKEYGIEKAKVGQAFFNQHSQELEDRCVSDCHICHKVYETHSSFLADDTQRASLVLEHKFQAIVNLLTANGFCFNSKRGQLLLDSVQQDLDQLDQQILTEFPPREVLIREFTPKATKYGTISKSSVPVSLRSNIHVYEVGKTYRHTKLVPFNPSSHKQLIEILHEAKWSPTDKTTTHIETERELNRAKHYPEENSSLDIVALNAKMVQLKKYGWKINENNLSTLPESAPSPARLLAKRILLESRRRTLTEWLGLVRDDGRIHGKFYGIGAWTHRMAHQSPNTANIPNEFRTDGSRQLLGKEMRSLWQAPKNRLLVGVDAEGIQLRIFAHYIDDPEFTEALVKGKKDDKSDPHSLNQRILGSNCRSRAAAKRFIYALLLGAGMGKLSEVLGCSKSQTEEALDRLMERYKGFALLKRTVIPRDAKRGYFEGLDGRRVKIPGDTLSERKHLCMSGYLQNGEAICMKEACLLWHQQLQDLGYEVGLEAYDIGSVKSDPDLDAIQHSAISNRRIAKPKIKLVNFVHDEWQTEVPNNVEIAKKVAEVQADSLRIVGEELKLKCPLAGSYWNDDHKDYTIATNWSMTH